VAEGVQASFITNADAVSIVTVNVGSDTLEGTGLN
jgi:hypothetical protein